MYTRDDFFSVCCQYRCDENSIEIQTKNKNEKNAWGNEAEPHRMETAMNRTQLKMHYKYDFKKYCHMPIVCNRRCVRIQFVANATKASNCTANQIDSITESVWDDHVVSSKQSDKENMYL